MSQSDLGILGGGQLAGMLVEAAHNLGITTTVCALEAVPAAALAHVLPYRPDSHEGIVALAQRCTAITCESENIPANVLAAAENHTRLHPSAATIAIAQDRYTEKNYLRSLRIPTAAFHVANQASEVVDAANDLGFPCLLKTRCGGYDGKGQVRLRQADEVAAAWSAIAGQAAIVEAMVPFTQECAQIAARDADGHMQFYPLTFTWHREGILRAAIPVSEEHELTAKARKLTARLLTALDYVGILTVEFFVVAGQLVANEIAPRVHNSGHWTIEGALTSQFENHVRAITGLPLGPSSLIRPTALVNCIGTLPIPQTIAAIPETFFHDYGKAAKPGRKLGHVTVQADNQAELWIRMQQILADVGEDPIADIHDSLQGS
jgi:5-(carboxyamino)imidazole ribonucleotide synthase